MIARQLLMHIEESVLEVREAEAGRISQGGPARATHPYRTKCQKTPDTKVRSISDSVRKESQQENIMMLLGSSRH